MFDALGRLWRPFLGPVAETASRQAEKLEMRLRAPPYAFFETRNSLEWSRTSDARERWFESSRLDYFSRIVVLWLFLGFYLVQSQG